MIATLRSLALLALPAATLGAAAARASAGHAAAAGAPAVAERLLHLAADPAISALLLAVGLLGLLVEMQTLHGIAGLAGIAALALFFGAHASTGLGALPVIALALLGLMGILFELHVVPGHGAAGILGSIALLLAMVLAFGSSLFFVALQSVATAIVLAVVLFALAVRIWPENAFVRRVTFAAEQGPEYVTSSDYTSLRGKVGSAASYLRPSGVAAIDGERVDVLTEGEFIPAGTPVRVTRVEGARIFVEPVRLPDYKEQP